MDPATHEEWNRRLHILLAIVALLFAILFVRLFQLQIAFSADYRKESEENRIAQKRIKAPRGHILDRDGEILARNRASYTIYLLRTSAQRDSAAVAALEEALGESIPYRRGKLPAIRLRRDVDFETVCIVEERLRDDWLLDIEIEPQRDYPFRSLAAHVTGYMGVMQENDVTQRPKRYEPGDYIGQTGIEKIFEDRLRGDDGVRYLEVDAKERIKREFPYPEREKDPVRGEDVTLTIDLDVQRAAELALPDTLAGSVVALDPQTGAILAFASKPTFDPNIFNSFQAQEERQLMLQSPAEPLLNRSIQGTYPPGSTLKMLGAVAALEAGITDTLSTFEACAGSLEMGDVVFHCFNRDGHGELNLLEAIEVSCNIYFNHLAQMLGVTAWTEMGQKLGFGRVTGINLDNEYPGLLPTRQWYRETEGVWVTGHLMNLVIGQGAMLATPLQMARYVAALGNGGRLVIPRVYGPPEPPIQLDISQNSLDIIRLGMHRVVHGENGTGKRAFIHGKGVAGKSGTAQNSNRSDDDAWFVAFAPYDEPQIAVAVVVEAGGPGGVTAAPIARRVMEAYFESVETKLPTAAVDDDRIRNAGT